MESISTSDADTMTFAMILQMVLMDPLFGRSATGIYDKEVQGIIMDSQDQVTCLLGDNGIGVGVRIIY